MVDQAMLIAILAATVTAGTPLLYAALGEIIAERAGVLNLGIEGMMLVGAVTGFLITVNTLIAGVVRGIGSGRPWR